MCCQLHVGLQNSWNAIFWLYLFYVYVLRERCNEINISTFGIFLRCDWKLVLAQLPKVFFTLFVCFYLFIFFVVTVLTFCCFSIPNCRVYPVFLFFFSWKRLILEMRLSVLIFLRSEAENVLKMFLNLRVIFCITWWLWWCGSYFGTDIKKNC